MVDRDIVMTDFDRQRLDAVLAKPSQNESDPCAQILERCIRHARILPQQQIPQDVVTMRSIVRLRNVDTGRQRAVSLTFPEESDATAGRMSILSPAGVALLGCRAGEQVQWEDAGDLKKFELLDIIYQPESAGHFDL